MKEMEEHWYDDPDLEFLWWKYDDGTFGSAQLNDDTGCYSDFKLYKTQQLLDAEISRSKESGVKVRRLRFLVGLGSHSGGDVLDFVNKENKQLKKGFRELKRMIASYAKDGSSSEIISLVTLILSGYLARLFIKEQKNQTIYFSRAPLILVRKSSRDITGGFEHLERIAQSLIVDTSRDWDFVIENPPVIPTHNRETDIESCAYAKIAADEAGSVVPTLYRDTAVLVHGRFFKGHKVQEFAERNKWASVLIFDMKIPHWNRLFAEIDMDKMNLAQWDWNNEKIHHLITCFVLWLSINSTGEKLGLRIAEWKKEAEDVVSKYNYVTGVEIKQGSGYDLACLQVTTVRAFVEYLLEDVKVDQQECVSLYDEWLNALLPGSRDQVILERSEKAAQESQEAKERNIIGEFEKLLKTILEHNNGSKIYLLSKGKGYPRGPELDLEKDPWVFLAMMKIQKKDVPVIKIRYEELEKLAEKYGLLQNADMSREQLKRTLAKGRDEGQQLGYIHKMDNVSLTLGNDAKSKPGMTLLVEKMDFLDDGIRRELMDRISRGN